MSHFTVLVKVSPNKLKEFNGDVGKAIDGMLAPYQENNMGDCPKEYLQFFDKSEEIEQEANEVIRPDTYMAEQYPDYVGKTQLEAYDSDMEKFVEEFFGYKKNEETGKYGYWENPNKKWDWYQVGGRWSGILRLKEGVKPIRGSKSWQNLAQPDDPHTADVVQFKDFDLEGATQEANVKAEEFWEKYLKFKDLKVHDPEFSEADKDDYFETIQLHWTLESMGLRKCVKEPVRDEDGNVISRPEYKDVPFNVDDLKTKYRGHFEFGTFAVLDDDGWHERGKMGWFACSSDTPEEAREWENSYLERFLRNENPETYLAVVDCHI